jgi:hypothetical protein
VDYPRNGDQVMIIYAITEQYEQPTEYHATRAGAEWALANKHYLDPNHQYIEEIEVIN